MTMTITGIQLFKKLQRMLCKIWLDYSVTRWTGRPEYAKDKCPTAPE